MEKINFFTRHDKSNSGRFHNIYSDSQRKYTRKFCMGSCPFRIVKEFKIGLKKENQKIEKLVVNKIEKYLQLCIRRWKKKNN